MKGPFKYPLIGSFPYFLRHGGVNRMVAVLQKLYQDFGPIVELTAIGQKSIVIFDPDVYLKVQRASGTCPVGATDALWMLHAYFDKRQKSSGAMSYGTGEEWMRVRRLMQKGLFGPESAGEYGDRLHEVAKEASSLIAKQQGSLQYFLQCLSFEMVSYSLLGTRMNSLTTKEPLLHTTIRSMECASGMMMGPLQKLNLTFETKIWRDWVSSVDYMLHRTEEIIRQSKHTPTNTQTALSKPYIQILLEAGDLSEEEIVTNIPGLMMAGFETVASTLHWTLINLAENPSVQEELHQEIQTRLAEENTGKTRPFTHDDMAHLPYMKAVLREVHRLTPTAFAFLRKLDKPLTVSSEILQQVRQEESVPTGDKEGSRTHPAASSESFTLPAGAWLCFSPVGLATDPAFVSDPHEFRPERYAERCEGKLTRRERAQWATFDHPLMRDGFGFGPRKCLGARLAEMEIYSAICVILSEHRVSMLGGPSGAGAGAGGRERGKSYELANHAATFSSPAPTLIFTPRSSVVENVN